MSQSDNGSGFEPEQEESPVPPPDEEPPAPDADPPGNLHALLEEFFEQEIPEDVPDPPESSSEDGGAGETPDSPH